MKLKNILFVVVILVSSAVLILGCSPTPTPTPTPTVTPIDNVDMARDVAIAKANSTPGTVPTNISWSKQTTPASMPGGTITVNYSGISNGNWYIEITYTSGVSLENTIYNVKIQFDGMPPVWQGIVNYSEIVLY
ncbi:MAG: hypothetical protein WCP87_05480 [Atribacterota bacterium]